MGATPYNFSTTSKNKTYLNFFLPLGNKKISVRNLKYFPKNGLWEFPSSENHASLLVKNSITEAKFFTRLFH